MAEAAASLNVSVTFDAFCVPVLGPTLESSTIDWPWGPTRRKFRSEAWGYVTSFNVTVSPVTGPRFET